MREGASHPQTPGVTDTPTRPARATSEWPRRTAAQTGTELLLGLSFMATVATSGYAAATGHLAVVAQGTAVVFLVTLTCALVSWFRGSETR